MGSIRELRKKNGSFSYHAEIRLKGYGTRRKSFPERELAEKWMTEMEKAVQEDRIIQIFGDNKAPSRKVSNFYTVSQFAEKNKKMGTWPDSESILRCLYDKAKRGHNKEFLGAFAKVAGRVIIDEKKFNKVIEGFFSQ